MEENKNYSSTTNIDKNQLFKNGSSAVDVLADPLPKIGRFDERCNLRENGVFNNDINYGGSTSCFGEVKEKFKHNFELNKENGDGVNTRDGGKNKCQKSNNNDVNATRSFDLNKIITKDVKIDRKPQEGHRIKPIHNSEEFNSRKSIKQTKEFHQGSSERRKLALAHSRNISQLEPSNEYNKALSCLDYENCVKTEYDQYAYKNKLANKCNVDYEPSSSEISIDEFCNVTSLGDRINSTARLSGKLFRFFICNTRKIRFS